MQVPTGMWKKISILPPNLIKIVFVCKGIIPDAMQINPISCLQNLAFYSCCLRVS